MTEKRQTYAVRIGNMNADWSRLMGEILRYEEETGRRLEITIENSQIVVVMPTEGDTEVAETVLFRLMFG